MKINQQKKGLIRKSLKFIKSQKIILTTIICLIGYADVSAHASTITRKWCGGFFHRKFVAKAQTSVLSWTRYSSGYNCIGQYVGYNNYANWTTVCSNENKGCSRPQTATCTSSGNVRDRVYNYCTFTYSGYHPYYAYAKAQHLVGAIYLTYVSSGRGSAGLSGNVLLDEEKFAMLNDNGKSYGDINGDVDIDDENKLVINNLSGNLSISSNADYYSTLNFIVIKENVNISDDEALENEKKVENGDYSDVVYSAKINVSKNGTYYDEAFKKGLINNQIKEINSDGEKTVKFENFSVIIPLDVNLADDEKLTIISVIDGGFDTSTADVSKMSNTNVENNNLVTYNNTPKLSPNPAKDFVEVYLNPKTSELVNINIINSLGKVFINKSENINPEQKSIRINTEHLLPGNYIVEIKSPSITTTQKLLINR